MAQMTAGATLRAIQNAQAVLKKARKAFPFAKSGEADAQAIARQAWASLAQAHQVLAGIPWEAANEEVLTRAIALQRYETATLVRLRRIVRNESDVPDDFDEESD